MAIAAAAESTGMAAVLGGTREDVIATLTRHGLTAANENGANQIVAAGTLAQLAALSEEPPTGAKVRPLQVAGAFHTHFMASAKQAVADAAASMSISDPSITLVSNRGGDVVHSGQDFVDRLVAQVSSPVRWDLCMETFVAQGVTGIIELFPGGTLTAIAKRAIPGVELLAIKSPEDLEKVAAFTQSHAGRVSSDSSNQSEDTNA
jgi:[acyl-carrier-protein] S-malonyltransferase